MNIQAMHARLSIGRGSFAPLIQGSRTLPLMPFASGDISKNIREAFASEYQRCVDSVFISNTGMRIHVAGKKAGENWDRITSSTADDLLQLVDKSISKAGKILQQIKEAAETAQDKSLGDDKRMELQLEIGRLQHDLNIESTFLEEFLAGTTEKEARIRAINMHGSFNDTQAYKMLERAYDRILGGGGWDVAELMTLTEGGGEAMQIGWEITDNINVPTVGEILKIESRSVMDADAARVSKIEADKDIRKLKGIRGSLASYIKKSGENPPSEDPYSNSFNFKNSLLSSAANIIKSSYKDMVLVTLDTTKNRNTLDSRIRPLHIDEALVETFYPLNRGEEPQETNARV